MRWPHRGATRPPDDPAASMALLQEIRDRPLDPGYQSAAQSRTDAGLPASTGSRSPLLVLSALLLGFVLAVAALTLHAPDPVAAATRSDLVQRVQAAETLGDQHAALLTTLRRQVAELEASELGPGSGTDSTAGQIHAAAEQADAVPMSGPGVVLTLDDPPRPPDGAPDADNAAADNRVFAGDLQLVVNGLWSHGAEEISINDQRLTSTSSIRFAGEAIVVGFRGLNRPYAITAIGDVTELTDELTDGETGSYLGELQSQYGIVVDLAGEDDLTVPAAAQLGVFHAQAVKPGDSQSTEPPSDPEDN